MIKTKPSKWKFLQFQFYSYRDYSYLIVKMPPPSSSLIDAVPDARQTLFFRLNTNLLLHLKFENCGIKPRTNIKLFRKWFICNYNELSEKILAVENRENGAPFRLNDICWQSESYNFLFHLLLNLRKNKGKTEIKNFQRQWRMLK